MILLDTNVLARMTGEIVISQKMSICKLDFCWQVAYTAVENRRGMP
jgi:hypothetical protein